MPLKRRAPDTTALRLRGRALLVPRAFQHAPVGAVELAPDRRSALRERAHVAALLAPRAHDLSIEAPALQPQALPLPHRPRPLRAPGPDPPPREQRPQV